MATTVESAMSNGSTPRTLLLAPPSVATKEVKLRDIFSTFDRTTTDLQMLDRISAGFVTLPSNIYDSVLVLSDTDGSPSIPLQLLSRNVYTSLVPAMKAGAKLQVQGGSFDVAEAREAILAGLVEKNGVFQKPLEEERAAVPLRLRRKKVSAQATTNTGFNGLGKAVNGDDDELIDEDKILSEEDLKWPQQPPECQPRPGRRRRACKDCTCGLAAQIEEEDKARQADADNAFNILKLQSDDLIEADFTVQGKTGSCGSCALGDAFRCTGCPFIGLPAFKPGEEVRILNDEVFNLEQVGIDYPKAAHTDAR